MALVALVLVRFAGKLIVVPILVAVSTAFELDDLEDRFFPLGNVALVALYLGVAINEGIVRLGMRFHIE